MFGGLGIDEDMLNLNNDLLKEHTTGIGLFPNIKTEISGKAIDIEAIFNEELGSEFNFPVWKETLELQIALNDKVAPEWKTDPNQKQYSFWMAALDEVVEVLNSKHWKWWKDSANFGKVDWENVRVELIDIFHFLLSMAMQLNSSEMIYTHLIANEKAKEKGEIKTYDKKFFIDVWDHLLMAVFMRSLPLLIIRWVEFWYRAGGDMDLLFKEYRVKAALNLIRQQYGYGVKNNYRKMWPNNEAVLVEDNVMAKQLTEDITHVDSDTTQVIFDRLQTYYLQRVAL